MEKINILMIDDNISLIEMVKEYFSKNENINIVLEAYDGLEGMKIVEEKQDDFDLINLNNHFKSTSLKRSAFFNIYLMLKGQNHKTNIF